MMKKLLPPLVILLLSVSEPSLAQQNDASTGTRLVREMLRDWIRVQIKTARLQAEQQRMTGLLQERASASAELTRLQAEVFSDSDLANLEQVNPEMAALRREAKDRADRPVADLEKKIAGLEQQIGKTQKRIDEVLLDLAGIEAALDAAAKVQ